MAGCVRLASQHHVMIITADQRMAAVWWSLAHHCGYEVKLRTPNDPFLHEPADVVVIDLDAENFDGWGVVGTLRKAAGELENPWVIAMKAEVSDDDVDAAMAAGINELVGKAGGSEAYLATLQSADRVLHRYGAT